MKLHYCAAFKTNTDKEYQALPYSFTKDKTEAEDCISKLKLIAERHDYTKDNQYCLMTFFAPMITEK